MARSTSNAESRPAALVAPRFSLRAMLVAVTLLSLVFAVMAAVGVLWSLAILLVGGLAGAHVLGNSLGTRLRNESTRASSLDSPAARAAVRALPPAAPPRLAERASLHRVTGAVSLAAAAMGGELGAMLVAYTYPESSVAAVGLGALSLGILGGLASFAMISFVTVARQALRQAHAAARERSTRE